MKKLLSQFRNFKMWQKKIPQLFKNKQKIKSWLSFYLKLDILFCNKQYKLNNQLLLLLKQNLKGRLKN